MIEDADKKIMDSFKFIATQDFNRLAKINVHVRIENALENLATKNQLENAFNLGDKNREHIKKLQLFFFLSGFGSKTISTMMDHKII